MAITDQTEDTVVIFVCITCFIYNPYKYLLLHDNESMRANVGAV